MRSRDGSLVYRMDVAVGTPILPTGSGHAPPQVPSTLAAMCDRQVTDQSSVPNLENHAVYLPGAIRITVQHGGPLRFTLSLQSLVYQPDNFTSVSQLQPQLIPFYQGSWDCDLLNTPIYTLGGGSSVLVPFWARMDDLQAPAPSATIQGWQFRPVYPQGSYPNDLPSTTPYPPGDITIAQVVGPGLTSCKVTGSGLSESYAVLRMYGRGDWTQHGTPTMFCHAVAGP
jgi:hypothetical protein